MQSGAAHVRPCAPSAPPAPQEDAKRFQMELSALQEQCQGLVTQQQVMLESLAQRDREVGS